MNEMGEIFVGFGEDSRISNFTDITAETACVHPFFEAIEKFLKCV